jgi:hypothetical protein
LQDFLYGGETRFSEIGKFLSNKFSPTTRIIASILTGKNPNDYYGKLSEAEVKDFLIPLFVPLSAEQLVETINNEDMSNAEKIFNTTIAIYGVGIQLDGDNNKNSSKLRTETNKK